MKMLWVLVTLLSLNVGAFADTTGVTAEGSLFYKTEKGEIEQKEAKLFVPQKGQGKVQLTVGEEKIDAANFKVRKGNGRTIFDVVFVNPPHMPKNSVVVFSGTYVRGSNVALYYGDIYSRVPSEHKPLKKKPTMKWFGGFEFNAQVPSDRE